MLKNIYYKIYLLILQADLVINSVFYSLQLNLAFFIFEFIRVAEAIITLSVYIS